MTKPIEIGGAACGARAGGQALGSLPTSRNYPLLSYNPDPLPGDSMGQSKRVGDEAADALHAEVRQRFGVLPYFFRLAAGNLYSTPPKR